MRKKIFISTIIAICIANITNLEAKNKTEIAFKAGIEKPLFQLKHDLRDYSGEIGANAGLQLYHYFADKYFLSYSASVHYYFLYIVPIKDSFDPIKAGSSSLGSSGDILFGYLLTDRLAAIGGYSFLHTKDDISMCLNNNFHSLPVGLDYAFNKFHLLLKYYIPLHSSQFYAQTPPPHVAKLETSRFHRFEMSLAFTF